MDSKEIKKVVSETEKELREKEKEKQVKKVKEIVRRTLESIENVKKDKAEVDKKLKYLKMDLDDLKEGHLERIEERQSKDSEAKKYSVIIIVKEKEIIREREVPVYPSPWYWPYTIHWNSDYVSPLPVVYGNSHSEDNMLCDFTNVDYNSVSADVNGTSINCSIAKDFSAGAYEIGDKIINFR